MINYFFSLTMYFAENAVYAELFLRSQCAPLTEHGNPVTTATMVRLDHARGVTHWH